jgi:hypothetical protein
VVLCVIASILVAGRRELMDNVLSVAEQLSGVCGRTIYRAVEYIEALALQDGDS